MVSPTTIQRLALFFLTLATAVLSASAQSFAPAVNYAVGGNPSKTAVADLNNDGKPDLAVANTSSNKVSILVGNGDGTFGAKTDFDIAANVYAIVIADFNGDTQPDLATASTIFTPSQVNVSQVSVLFGNGNATFQPRVDYSLSNSAFPTSIAAGDFNGDGRKDLVTANQSAGNASVLLNQGNGTFAPPVYYPIGFTSTSVAIADFNEDGKLDLAVTCWNPSGVSVLLGKGDGTFFAAASHPTTQGSFEIATADFNADNNVDVITSNLMSSAISVMLGNGDGTFFAAVDYPAGDTPAAMVLGDFNVDGKLDVATTGVGFATLQGNGDGTFRKPRQFATPASSLTAQELNNDGKLDLIASDSSGFAAVILNQSGPRRIGGTVKNAFGDPLAGVQLLMTGALPENVNTAADGSYSFADLAQGGSYVLTPSQANYTFTPLSQAVNNLSTDQTVNFVGSKPKYIISGVVRDAVSLVPFEGVPVTLVESQITVTTASDGSFYFPPVDRGGNYTVIATLAGYTFLPGTITNLTGPRTVNLFASRPTFSISGNVFPGGAIVSLSGSATRIATSSGSSYSFTGLEAGGTYTVTVNTIGFGALFSRYIAPQPNSKTFSNLSANVVADFNFVPLNYPVPGLALGTAMADFNADGKLDVAVAAGDASGVIRIFLGKGNGELESPTDYPVGCRPQIVLTSDFNNDGKVDLASANSCGNNVSVLLGNGNGTFSAASNLSVGPTPITLAIGDFNGDGKPDLATGNMGGTFSISVRLGVGDGTFGNSIDFPAARTLALAAADFNGDGKADLAIANTDLNSVGIRLSNGDGTFQASVDFPANPAPKRVKPGDVNNDGKVDLVTMNLNDTVSVLLGNDAGSFGAPTSYTIISPDDMVLADLNGDGKLDIAVAAFSGSCSFMGNGDGIFQPRVGIAGIANALSAGDLDNDGRKDLVLVDSSSNNLSVLLNIIPTPPPVKISGQIKTAGGMPVAGVTVSVTGSQSNTPTTTDANGNYTFNLPRGGTYLINPTLASQRFAPTGLVFNRVFTDQVGDFVATPFTPSLVGRVTDNNGAALSGVTLTLSGAQSATTTSNANGTYAFSNLTVGGNYVITPSFSSGTFTPSSRTFNNLSLNTGGDFRSSISRSAQLDALNYVVNEGGLATVTVTRTGDTSGAATVDYKTSDNAGSNNCNAAGSSASSRCDYETAVGALHFAAGETSRTILIPTVDDSYSEGPESFFITLTNANGSSLGLNTTATITINPDSDANGSNPINQAAFFVRLHYLDFLNREPDAGGLAFWTDQITSCGSDQSCIDLRRINVSAAFFLSIEFQETGYLVYLMHKSAYGNLPGAPVPVKLSDFLPDSQQISSGVIVGAPGWEQLLENNKQAFAADFVKRPRFVIAYPASLTPAEFVDALFANTGITPSPGARADAINEFGSATSSADPGARARALRRVADNSTFRQQQTNQAFVLMQYFGYLRRNPFDPPEASLDYSGYNFWLNKLNQFNGNFVNADMVKAFIVSGEYRARFGP